MAVLVRLADELQPLQISQGNTAARRPVVFLEQRLELLRRSGRLVLAGSVGRGDKNDESKNKNNSSNSFRNHASGSSAEHFNGVLNASSYRGSVRDSD